MTMYLETERLRLKPLEPVHFEDLKKMLTDERVMYAYGGAFGDSDVETWYVRQLCRYRDDGGLGLLAVELKDSGLFVGQCGITMQDCREKRVPEIGYLLRWEFWHRGLATEAAVACREYAFSVLNLQRIYSIIRDSNIASQRVAERVGMRRVDEIVKHYRGIVMPHYVYCVENAQEV